MLPAHPPCDRAHRRHGQASGALVYVSLGFPFRALLKGGLITLPHFSALSIFMALMCHGFYLFMYLFFQNCLFSFTKMQSLQVPGLDIL